MKSIARRIGALRERRRDKRVERLGGHPTRLPVLAVESFQPALNHSERMNDTVSSVARLGAEGVDEATAFPLDNLVNADGIQWQHKLTQQHLAYTSRADHQLREIEGVVEQYWHLYNVDLRRLHATEIAVESAMLALSGEPLEPAHGAAPHGAATSPAAGGRSRVEALAAVDPLDGLGSLKAPRGTRAELRRIFEPQDARRVPHWAETGFRDGTLLGGRPRSAYLHALALLLAAGADIGAFTQVVEMVMTTSSGATVFLVVAGLAAVVLYIAHMIGAMLRNVTSASPSSEASRGRRLRSRLGSGAVLAGCAIAWGAIGGLAFWVRLTVPLPSTPAVGGGPIGGGGVAGSASSSNPYPLQVALIFLGLYVATGIVAALGAYFTHNPYRGRYVVALRAYRKAAERAAATASQFGRAEAAQQRQAAELRKSDQVLAEVKALDKAFSEQLKQSVRLQIAVMSKDPAVTDAVFDADHAPYWPGSNGSSSNGNSNGSSSNAH
jgi:hypothetical protein